MTLITCEECLHRVVCPICFSYKDVLNVKNYCKHFVDKSAFEKQIPKKPIEDGYFAEPCACPNCGGDVTNMADNDYHFQYCHYCGQALDWSDTE